MSKRDAGPLAVIEYSKDAARTYDPRSGRVQAASSIADASTVLSSRSVVVALSRRTSFVRSARLPDVDHTALGAILNLQAAQLFPVASAELSLEASYSDNKNSEGRLATLAACKCDVLRSIREEAESAGLKVESVVPSAWSSVLLARQAGVTECAVVGRDADGVSIDLVQGGALASARSVAHLDSVEAILAEVQRTAASVGLQDCPLFCTGSMSLPGAEQWPQDSLSVLSSDDRSLQLELPEVKSAKDKKERDRRKNVVMLLWVAVLGVSAVVADIRLDELDKFKKGEDRWTKKLKTIRDIHGQTEARANSLRDQQRVISTTFEPKQTLSDVSIILNTLAPTNLWLTGLTVERGKRASIRGTATTGEAVSDYLKSLGGQSRLRDVKLVFRNNALIEKTPVVNFSISMHVVGNFPLMDKPEKGGSVAKR